MADHAKVAQTHFFSVFLCKNVQDWLGENMEKACIVLSSHIHYYFENISYSIYVYFPLIVSLKK